MTTDTPTPADAIREVLTGASRPMKLADITKPKKEQAATHALLRQGVEQGWAFAAKSGANGAERYWSKDEVQATRDAVLATASEPKSLAALKQAAKGAFGSDAKFAAAVVDGMVTAGQLHAQSARKNAPFGKSPPLPKNDPAKVRAALLSAAATPLAVAKLVAAAVTATKADRPFVAAAVNTLIEAGELHAHPPAKGKSILYGADKPREQPPLERKPHADALAKLVVAAVKLQSAAGVTADELVTALRAKLPGESATLAPPHADEPVTASPPVAVVPPVAVPPAPEAPAPLTPDRIRAGLASAYKVLRNDVEGESGMVEIRRLYHEAKRALPALGVAEFHRELTALQREWVLDLHSLTEVQHAKEPELALRQNDRLLYYVMWR